MNKHIELLDEYAFAECEKVVKYVDIPLQHSHPEVLKLMSRPSFDYRPMIENIRRIGDEKVQVAIVGKYVQLEDSYLSSMESLRHAGFVNNVGVDIIQKTSEDKRSERYQNYVTENCSDDIKEQAFEKGYNAIPGAMAQPINTWNDFKKVLKQLKFNNRKKKRRSIRCP